MRSMLRGNRDLIKAMNRNLLLNILRREGSVSRTQLTDISGLSVGAVSQITTELLENNWVLEIGEGDYTGGRRQTLLRLNPTAGYALGLKVMENRLVCAVTDFAAKVLHYHEQPFVSDHDPRQITDAIAKIINDTIEGSNLPRSAVLGVGIGLAGVVDPHEGVVDYSPFFGWRNVPLGQMLEATLGLPVSIENDVNTLTLSEYLFGAGRHQQNFVVVTIGRGIGMGMVINGQLYQGARGGAGELGHIILDLGRARSGTSESGSLETLAADASLLSGGAQTFANVAAVVQAAEGGDTQADAALVRSGEYMGVALATVINILAPSLLIVSGEGVTAGERRLQPMFEAMRRYTFDGLLEHVEILVEAADDMTWARGAASLVMNRVFASPLIMPEAAR